MYLLKLLCTFDIVGIEEKSGVLHIRLDEQAIVPSGYTSGTLSPNGFFPSSRVYDFPIRDRKVVLHIRRRRWLERDTGKSLSRSLEMTAEGTRYTVGLPSTGTRENNSGNNRFSDCFVLFSSMEKFFVRLYLCFHLGKKWGGKGQQFDTDSLVNMTRKIVEKEGALCLEVVTDPKGEILPHHLAQISTIGEMVKRESKK